MLQVIPDTPVDSAIKALEEALRKATAEVAKIQNALVALRPAIAQQQAQMQALQGQVNVNPFQQFNNG